MGSYIYIGFSRPVKPTIFSRGIMWFEGWQQKKKIDFSHVYIQFYSENTDRYLIFQTNKHGAHFIERGNFLRKNYTKHEYYLAVTKEQRNNMLRACFDYAGTSYGFKSIVGMGIARVLSKILGHKVKNPLSDGMTTSVCSELTSYLISLSDIIIEKTDWEYYGPAQLDKELSQILSLTPEYNNH